MNRLQGKTIVVTRPIEQAKKLVALLKDAGAQPVLFPLIEIRPLADYSAFDAALNQLQHIDLAIFISTNAVQNAMPRVIQHYPALPKALQFAAIGPTTAVELLNYGVKHVIKPTLRFDSEALLALAEMQQVAGKNVMIFRGIGGREVLADTLTARGANVVFAESYRRINPQTNTQLLTDLSAKNQLNAIVVTSSEAMRSLLELSENGQAVWLKNTHICVNHARIRDDLPDVLKSQSMVASASGDPAMLQCLQNSFADITLFTPQASHD